MGLIHHASLLDLSNEKNGARKCIHNRAVVIVPSKAGEPSVSGKLDHWVQFEDDSVQ